MIGVIDLPEKDEAILREVLRQHLPPAVAVFVFGSRATGSARRYSDLDLALAGDQVLDPEKLADLKDALTESDLTIKVDLVDLHALTPDFRRIVESQMLRLPLDHPEARSSEVDRPQT